MTALMEKVRQKCFFASGFEPTNNNRATAELAEVEEHSKAVAKMLKHVKELQKATDSMIKEAERAYSKAPPRVFHLEAATRAPINPSALLTASRARAVPVEVEDPATVNKQSNLAQLADVRATLSQQLQNRVYIPSEKWMSDYEAAKTHMKELEDLRLALDHTRRTHASAELKKVKQERNKGAASDGIIAKLDIKDQSLETAKTRFRDKEASVHEELSDLVARSDLLREAIQATFAVLHVASGRAATASPPPLSSAASGHHSAADLSPGVSSKLQPLPSPQQSAASAGAAEDLTNSPLASGNKGAMGRRPSALQVPAPRKSVEEEDDVALGGSLPKAPMHRHELAPGTPTEEADYIPQVPTPAY